MPHFLSLQNVRSSTDLLADVLYKPAEGKCRIQPRAWEHSIPHTSGEIYFIHLLMPRASALNSDATEGPLTWAGLPPGGHWPALAAACNSSLVPSASRPSTCMDSEESDGGSQHSS